MGLSIPGDRGDMFCPMGFRTREVGVGKGVQAEVQRELEDRVREIGERTWPEEVGDGRRQEYLPIASSKTVARHLRLLDNLTRFYLARRVVSFLESFIWRG